MLFNSDIMIANVQYKEKSIKINLSKPIDISLPITDNPNATRAWYIDSPTMQPVVLGDWIGDVNQGSGVNFFNIKFNPHAHGTHTETAGHILEKRHSINQNLKQFFFIAELVTVKPEEINGALEINLTSIKVLKKHNTEAFIIRTLPNNDEKKTKNYSDTNPPYLTIEAINWLKEQGVKHLMIDLPSVDPEKDEGAVAAHHAFWNTGTKLRLDATITELIYVPTMVKDGLYFMNLQVAAFENDAAPSRPLLFDILN